MSDVLPPNQLSALPIANSDAYQVPNQPIHAERQLRVICVGAGASGLLFAYKMQRSFANFELTLYEKNQDIAGTWFENRYPGCACDVPAHNYVWSFEPNPKWSAVYASSKEIYDYFDTFARNHDLRKYCKLRHQVVGARWNNELGGYDIEVEDLTTRKVSKTFCHILINAGGILNTWRYPPIPGISDYKGKLLHTANWDESVDLKDKTVGLIGNGSSGIQVLPTLQPHVKKITTFIRGPAYISPVQGLEQHHYTAEEKYTFANDPNALMAYRKNIERGQNKLFDIFHKSHSSQKENREYVTTQMREKIDNAYLEEKLIPEWPLGCRRLSPGVGYLESLSKPNVEVVYGEIQKITPYGCLCDDGKEYKVDVLICATGFDTTFKPRFPLIGFGNKNLQEEWAQEPRSYLGLAAAEFPNYMIFLGPNCPIGNGPVLMGIEAQADWMLKVISRFQVENIHSFAPKKEAVDDFIEHKNEFMQRTVWIEPCRSWYKADRPDAPITALWPGSSLHYAECVADVRWDDMDVKYKGNRFNYLGNGYSQTEIDPLADTAFYIREADDSPYQSKRKQREAMTRISSQTDAGSGRGQ